MTAQQADTHEAVRPRPALHFTARDGWINDPYGIAWDGSQYHMYFQAVPGQVVWGPQCHWGHATSSDLVTWVEQPIALAPQPFELGCWSGTVVHEVQPPILFYTRVAGEDWEIGQVARASPALEGRGWTSRADDVVISGPPEGLAVRAFRDPYVFKDRGGWTMLMAAALEGNVAAVLQYRSADLVTWSFDGVLCSRPSQQTDPVWTGSLWECPQLFPLDDRWVLLVSVWDASTLHYVVASVGDYDGTRFVPQSWQRLTHGRSAYAMSAFVDKEGRRCAISWLREEPQINPALKLRAGAHSVASVLGIDADGRLHLEPHPDVTSLRGTPVVPGSPAAGRQIVIPDSGPIDIAISPNSRVHLGDVGGARATFEVDRDGTLALDRPGFDAEILSMGAGPASVMVDADIVEVFGRGAYAAYRIRPATAGSDMSVSVAGGDDIAVRPLRPDPGP